MEMQDVPGPGPIRAVPPNRQPAVFERQIDLLAADPGQFGGHDKRRSGLVDVDGWRPRLDLMVREAFQPLLQNPKFPRHTVDRSTVERRRARTGPGDWDPRPARAIRGSLLTARPRFCYDR
jgi:hypothetical protein